MDYKKVSVIIVAYTSRNYIEDCLNSIHGTYPNLEIIIKQQLPSDGLVELVKSKYPEVVIFEGENNGLAKGNNECVKRSTGEYLLFMGTDARVEKDTIRGLVDWMEINPDVGGVTAKLILGDGVTLDMDAHRAFPTPWISFCRLFGLSKIFKDSRKFNGYFLPGKDMNSPHDIELCISHFMMVPRKVYEMVNGFDEDYFLYGEDVQFCYDIKQAGYRLMYLPQFKATHLKGVGVGIRSTTRKISNKPLRHRLKMQKLSTEAMIIFMKKNYTDKYPWYVLYPMYGAAKLLGVFRVLVESLK
ncbi:MAG: hypothetical protein QG570_456 [Patescibacteria group bacterium]|nr:hypothetical protein [Patescibacteria group bacterium]